MKSFCFILCLFLSGFQILAQDAVDESLSRLRENYQWEGSLKCEVMVKINVEGMVIPEKKVYVEFIEGENPRIEGKGLSLLPKKGTLEQFRNLLHTPLQAIFLSRRGNNLVYKLVSLDPASDWITADIEFDEEAYRIHKAVVNTKKNGTFQTVHKYGDGRLPKETEILFDVKEFKLPLKFIGGEQAVENWGKEAEDKKGSVTLLYTYL